MSGTIESKILTPAGSGSASNSFTVIHPDAGSSPTASTSTDTLNVTSSDSTLTVTGNSGTKTIDIKVTPTASELRQNLLLNSNFDFWQRGTSTTIANAATGYQADRWYVKNSLGTNGVITFSQVTGVSDGAKFGANVKITTAPTALQTNGTELYQTLENQDSLQLYNQTASFSVKVKALGNVNQCGIQFFYKTTEAKVDTSIGSEQTATVNTSTFTTITISGQAIGTSQTTSGVVGVRIRVTGVSSGNTYDLNNGFVVEQAIVNLGAVSATYQRQCKTMAQELSALQRYYEKSYQMTDAPGSTNSGGEILQVSAGTNITIHIGFQVRKRASPGTKAVYSIGTGAVDTIRDTDNNLDRAASYTRLGQMGFMALATTGSVTNNCCHWAADAEI